MDTKSGETASITTGTGSDISNAATPSDVIVTADGLLHVHKDSKAARDVRAKKTPPKLKSRDTWATRFDFLLAICGASVGLGNVWRFPFLCYKNGGGAFLIPYFVCVFLGGIPMFFLEVSVGQFMGECIVGAFGRLCPLFTGLGITSTIVEIYVCVYYNVILAWCIYYLLASFTSSLPWATCGNAWNTDSCRDFSSPSSVLNVSDYNMTNGLTLNDTFGIFSNSTGNNAAGMVGSQVTPTDPATEYWQRHVLHVSAGIDEAGPLKWDLVGCLFLAWLVVYLCICKGIKSSGKVMYVTATSPYLLLLILLVRGVTLPGAYEGIKFYLLPDWRKLLDPQVWTDAGTQVFFSYSIGHAKLVALGSYNAYKHNSYRDCLSYAAVNSATSFLSGFVIFPVLGFMALQNGLHIKDVAASGPGLAFIAYPKAVAQLPFAPFWSILFFICLLMLGLDTQFVGVEAFTSTLVDVWPLRLRRGYRREILIGVTCCVMFLIGLSMVTYGGVYVFLMFDYYMGSRILLAVVLAEIVLVVYVYGIGRYCDNMRMMLGFDVGVFMRVCWLVLTPLGCLIMFGLCLANIDKLTYNKTYQFPRWSEALGWSMAASALMAIPAYAVYKIYVTPGPLTQRLSKLRRPQLLRHQLRPQDDLKDLMPGEDQQMTDPSHVINNKHSELPHGAGQTPLLKVKDVGLQA